VLVGGVDLVAQRVCGEVVYPGRVHRLDTTSKGLGVLQGEHRRGEFGADTDSLTELLGVVRWASAQSYVIGRCRRSHSLQPV